MRIAIGADHGGFALKFEIAKTLAGAGHQVLDKGPFSFDPADDYPDFVLPVCQAVQRGESDRGIIICGSGVGASMTANRFTGIRAAVCHDTYSARQGVEHDDMNVLCLGARVVGSALALELVRAFLGARFTGEERHVRRLAKVAAIEKSQ
ncbi:MAG: ribose 5-phosphate isomerase B, partial [Anaerolineae bacterium]|nr:ribose 5-phosphate isomerase B [Anaerolineae bacterium]